MSRVYISDLDGTLLNNQPALSDYSRKQIEKIIASGVNFTVASARNLGSLRQMLGDIDFPLPVIEINGAYITDYKTAEHLVVNQIQSSIVFDICTQADQLGCMPFITAFDGTKDQLYYEGVCNGGMEWFLGDKTEGHSRGARQIEKFDHILHEQIVCLTVIGYYQQIKELYTAIEERFPDQLDNHFFPNPYSPDWYWLTIHDTKARKELAINKLMELHGFSPEQIVVFGDNLNDAGMMALNQCGATSIAVANATEQIRGLASKVIGTNEADSVVNYIIEQEGIF